MGYFKSTQTEEMMMNIYDFTCEQALQSFYIFEDQQNIMTSSFKTFQEALDLTCMGRW